VILIQLEGIIQESLFAALPPRKAMLKTKIKDTIYSMEFSIDSFQLGHYLDQGCIIKFDGILDEDSKEIKELSNVWIKIKN